MTGSKLWLPGTAKELLCLETDDCEPDNQLEIATVVNPAIVGWLNGTLDTGTLTDTLLEYDVDPSILDVCEDFIAFLHRS